MTATYKIGQILYVVLRKEARVYPLQVVEVIKKTTLDGEAVAYMVKGGTSADQVLSLDQVDGELFETADTAKRVLIARWTANINKLVDSAVKKAREWYPQGHEQSTSDLPPSLKKPPAPAAPTLPELMPEVDSETVIELPDGTRAKVKQTKLPDSLLG